LEIDEETYLSSFKPHLMDVVYTWATGATFAHICKMTDVFEGMVKFCAFIFLPGRRSKSAGCWWLTPVILLLRRQRYGGLRFKASPGK
jgi:hypothetical protein